MTYRVIYLFAVVIAAGWELAGRYQPAAGSSVQDRVQTIAAGMSAITPKTLPSGIVMRSVRAEGTVLVTQMDGMHDWRPTYTDDEMKRMISVGVCSRAGMTSLLGDGARVRFDLTAPDGTALPSLTVDHCP